VTDRVRRGLEVRGPRGRHVIVGVRPEDFEDAAFVPEGHRGWTFETPIELIESVGSEIYAHFTADGTKQVTGDAAEELRELRDDAGTTEAPSGTSGVAVARVDSGSAVREGVTARLWLDVDKVH